jgi:hypothetical protein
VRPLAVVAVTPRRGRTVGGSDYPTPTELAREVGMTRKEVVFSCLEWGVPIFQGRIERKAFLKRQAESDPLRVEDGDE